MWAAHADANLIKLSIYGQAGPSPPETMAKYVQVVRVEVDGTMELHLVTMRGPDGAWLGLPRGVFDCTECGQLNTQPLAALAPFPAADDGFFFTLQYGRLTPPCRPVDCRPHVYSLGLFEVEGEARGDPPMHHGPVYFVKKDPALRQGVPPEFYQTPGWEKCADYDEEVDATAADVTVLEDFLADHTQALAQRAAEEDAWRQGWGPWLRCVWSGWRT